MATLAPGTTIGRYRIRQRLGGGGMGVVYLALDEQLERQVALKVIAPALADDPEFARRFTAEARAAAAVDHPNLLPIYEAGSADGRLFMAMRYVRGFDLGTLIARDGALAVERTVSLVGQTAAALDAAHAADLVHRDVKPGNVLVGPGDHAYLADFGLATAAEGSRLTRPGQLAAGSADYIAPELVEGRPADARSDIYALACLTYACLTGQPPFRRADEVATLYAHVHEPPPAPTRLRPELSPRIEQALARGMAKDPAERHPRAGSFAAALAEASGVGEVTEMRTGAPEAPARRGPDRPLWAAAAVTLAALLIVGWGALGFFGGAPASSPASPRISPVATLTGAAGTAAPSGDASSADSGVRPLPCANPVDVQVNTICEDNDLEPGAYQSIVFAQDLSFVLGTGWRMPFPETESSIYISRSDRPASVLSFSVVGELRRLEPPASPAPDNALGCEAIRTPWQEPDSFAENLLAQRWLDVTPEVVRRIGENQLLLQRDVVISDRSGCGGEGTLVEFFEFPEGDPFYSFHGAKLRFLHPGDVPVPYLITIEAPTADEFDAFAPIADEVLLSLQALPSDRPPASATASAVASATSDPFPNHTEQALIGRLPGALGDDCRRERSRLYPTTRVPVVGPPHSILATAKVPRDGIKCDLPLGQAARTLWLRQYASPSAVVEDVEGLISVRRAPFTPCGEAASGSETWRVGERRVGTVICWGGDDLPAWIAWTYEEDAIFATAVNDAGDWQALFAWWQSTARYMDR